jgi:outer membrane protein OmpA-like peptidoglycan-associated protein
MRAPRPVRVAALVAAGLLALTGVARADTAPPPANGLPLRNDHATVDRVLDVVSRVVDLKAAATSVDQGGHSQLNLNTDVLFDFGSAQLTAKAQVTLQAAADAMTKAGATSVRVDGYTDSIGDDATNLALSRQRAQAVADALGPLVGAGKVTFVVQGHGKADPIAANTTASGGDNPDGRALNRRVTLSYGK